jgi:hypothetical protein
MTKDLRPRLEDNEGRREPGMHAAYVSQPTEARPLTRPVHRCLGDDILWAIGVRSSSARTPDEFFEPSWSTARREKEAATRRWWCDRLNEGGWSVVNSFTRFRTDPYATEPSLYGEMPTASRKERAAAVGALVATLRARGWSEEFVGEGVESNYLGEAAALWAGPVLDERGVVDVNETLRLDDDLEDLLRRAVARGNNAEVVLLHLALRRNEKALGKLTRAGRVEP